MRPGILDGTGDGNSCWHGEPLINGVDDGGRIQLKQLRESSEGGFFVGEATVIVPED